jgi:hypothetical protein
VRFPSRHLYVSGIAFSRNFDQPVVLWTTLSTCEVQLHAWYIGGDEHAELGREPANFTYVGTTIVDRGAVGFAVPDQPFRFARTSSISSGWGRRNSPT